MMKIQKIARRRKFLLGLSIGLLFTGAAYLTGAYAFKLPPFSKTAEAPLVSETIKQEYTPNRTDTKRTDSGIKNLPSNPESTTSEEVPVSNTSSVAITELKQVNGTVRASAKVSPDEGLCVFLYTTEGDKPVSQELTAKDSACHSSVSEVSFSKLGTWQLKVTYYKDGKKVEATQNVEIR